MISLLRFVDSFVDHSQLEKVVRVLRTNLACFMINEASFMLELCQASGHEVFELHAFAGRPVSLAAKRGVLEVCELINKVTITTTTSDTHITMIAKGVSYSFRVLRMERCSGCLKHTEADKTQTT